MPFSMFVKKAFGPPVLSPAEVSTNTSQPNQKGGKVEMTSGGGGGRGGIEDTTSLRGGAPATAFSTAAFRPISSAPAVASQQQRKQDTDKEHYPQQQQHGGGGGGGGDAHREAQVAIDFRRGLASTTPRPAAAPDTLNETETTRNNDTDAIDFGSDAKDEVPSFSSSFHRQMPPQDILTVHLDPLNGTASIRDCPAFLRRAIDRRSTKLRRRKRIAENAAKLVQQFGLPQRTNSNHHSRHDRSTGDAETSTPSSSAAYEAAYSHIYAKTKKAHEERQLQRKIQKQKLHQTSLPFGYGSWGEVSFISSSASSSLPCSEDDFNKTSTATNGGQKPGGGGGEGAKKSFDVFPLGVQCLVGCESFVESLLEGGAAPTSASHNNAMSGGTFSNAYCQDGQLHPQPSSCTSLTAPSFCTFCGCRYPRIIDKQTGAFVLPKFCTKCGRAAPRYLVNDLPFSSSSSASHNSISSSSYFKAGPLSVAVANGVVGAMTMKGPRGVHLNGLVVGNTPTGVLGGGGAGGVKELEKKNMTTSKYGRSGEGTVVGEDFRTNVEKDKIGSSGGEDLGSIESDFLQLNGPRSKVDSTDENKNGEKGLDLDEIDLDEILGGKVGTTNGPAETAIAIKTAENTIDIGDDDPLLTPSTKYRARARMEKIGRSLFSDVATQTDSTPKNNERGMEGSVASWDYNGFGTLEGKGDEEDQDHDDRYTSVGGVTALMSARAKQREVSETTKQLVELAVKFEREKHNLAISKKEAEIRALKEECERVKKEASSAAEVLERRVRGAIYSSELEVGWQEVLATVDKVAATL